MLDTMIAKIDETDYAVEIKTIRDLKAKLLGTKKGNLPEYRAISNDAIKYVVPRYERTHIVKIETMTSGEKVLTCGNDELGIPCRFTKHGQACRHMYHLLERTPTIRDAVVRWHVSYAHYYGKNDEMTQHFIKLRDHLKIPGVPLIAREVFHILNILPTGEGTKKRGYFTRSLGKLQLCGSNTYWHKIRHRLPHHVQVCIAEDDSSDDESVEGIIEGSDDDGASDVAFDNSTEGLGKSSTSVTVGNSLVHHGSEYMVPSQLTQQQDSDSEPVECQGQDAKSDFLPIFETVCKFTNSTGVEGRRVLEQELNAIKDKQLAIIAKNKKPTSGKDVYNDYMHLFESVCGYTNDAGDEGQQELMIGLNRLKKKQVDLITEQSGISLRGVASMPTTSTKTVDKRIPSRCSPKKNKKQKTY